MSLETYKNEFGNWVYPELPDTVRPARWEDLFMPSGRPNIGRLFLCRSYIYNGYITSRITQGTPKEDIEKMLNDKVVYVKK